MHSHASFLLPCLPSKSGAPPPPPLPSTTPGVVESRRGWREREMLLPVGGFPGRSREGGWRTGIAHRVRGDPSGSRRLRGRHCGPSERGRLLCPGEETRLEHTRKEERVKEKWGGRRVDPRGSVADPRPFPFFSPVRVGEGEGRVGGFVEKKKPRTRRTLFSLTFSSRDSFLLSFFLL